MRSLLFTAAVALIAGAPLRVRVGVFQASMSSSAACARGWLDTPQYEVACVYMSTGMDSLSYLESGGLDLAQMGSTPFTAGVARGVAIEAVYMTGGE